MEIIARLREERQALVERIAQIDKMLRQYEEWGREAQRLLSLTGMVESDPVAPPVAPAAQAVHTGTAVSDQSNVHDVGNGKVRMRTRSAVSVVGSKTPIPEFETAVIDVLRASGQPMDRVALYEALTARGIVIGDGGREKDLNALSARVYRMAQDPKNRIFGERGQGYRLIVDDDASGPESVDDSCVDNEDGDPSL